MEDVVFSLPNVELVPLNIEDMLLLFCVGVPKMLHALGSLFAPKMDAVVVPTDPLAAPNIDEVPNRPLDILETEFCLVPTSSSLSPSGL